MQNDTVFHKIVRRELPAYVVAEDEHHMAFLDIFPTHKAQTVVIPKSPSSGKFSDAKPAVLQTTILFAQKVALLIETKVPGVIRCQVVIEGFEIDYLHIKLIPAYTLPEDAVHHSGERASEADLAAVHAKLTT